MSVVIESMEARQLFSANANAVVGGAPATPPHHSALHVNHRQRQAQQGSKELAASHTQAIKRLKMAPA